MGCTLRHSVVRVKAHYACTLAGGAVKLYCRLKAFRKKCNIIIVKSIL